MICDVACWFRLLGDCVTSSIRRQLVWARPPLADMPLWNATLVRGKIVAIMRCADACTLHARGLCSGSVCIARCIPKTR
jgi:hypothetical protein